MRFAFLLFVLLWSLNAYSFDAFDYQKALGIGIDVNWVFHKKEIKFYSKQEPKDFKEMGFNTVRIRFDLRRVNVNQICKVVKDSLDAGLNVVLANSGEEFKEHPNEKTMYELINDWTLIAKKFKKFPYSKLSYDLIIEPGKGLNKNLEKLNQFYKRAYKEIRKIDNHRIIMFAPAHCSNPYYLKYLWLPKNDENVMVEWHMYASGPSKSAKKKLWINGSKYEKELILDKIKVACNFAEKHHIPMWVGAWMPGNYNKGDDYSIEEQIKFAKFLEKQLALRHIPNAINADQQFYDFKKKKWREDRLPVIRAILETFKNYWNR